MQITALIQVINYLKETSGNQALLEGYKKLIEIVREASEKQQVDFSEAILKEKEQLRHFFLETDPSDMGYDSYCLFGKINNDQLFGKPAADYLENLLTSDRKNYRTIYSDLSSKVKQISKLSETLNQFQQLFDQLVPAEVFHFAEETYNKSSLLLYFGGHMSVNNIIALERYSRLWGGILSAFSKLTGEEILMLDISSFHNGNLSLSVAIEDKTFNAIKSGVVEILGTLSHILKIRKIQIEIVHLPLYNDLNELLEEEIRTLINHRAWESAQKLISVYLNTTIDADEITNDISRSLKQILNFVEKGGKIEFKPLESTPEVAQTNKILIESFAIAYELASTTDSLAQALAKKQVI